MIKEKKKTPLSTSGIQRNFLNLIENIYKNPIANIIYTGEKLDAFPLRMGTRQGYSFSPLLFSIVPEVLGNEIRQE